MRNTRMNTRPHPPHGKCRPRSRSRSPPRTRSSADPRELRRRSRHPLQGDDSRGLVDDHNERDPKDDAFYTTSAACATFQAFVAASRYFCSSLVADGTHTVVCPTAGFGALTRGFVDNALLFDMHPQPKCGVAGCKYMELDIEAYGKFVIIMENPPFSQYDAVPFFIRMAIFAATRVMFLIFPDRFRGDPLNSKGTQELDENFHCVDHKLLPYNSFEKASGSAARILTSIQVWVRKPYKRAAYAGIPVGNHRVAGADATHWVKRRNPLLTKLEVVTATKPYPDTYKSFPVKFPDSVSYEDGKAILAEAVKSMWEEYPHHSMISLHAGNLKLHLDLAVAARDQAA